MVEVADRRLPVIYVRGFAGSGIDEVIDDPFYGFNEGSVHVRVDGTGEPQFHQFESPMLRLMTDEGYQLLVHGNQRGYLERQEDGSVPATTLWVHRFYDVSASTLGRHPEEFSLEKAAEDLWVLVQLVLAKTGAPQAHLVAHSMGGLICRSMIQRVVPDDPLLGGTLDAASRYVASVFTYGTPHGGIEFAVGFGLLERLRDATGFQGADIFGPRRMYDYLTPALGGTASTATFRADEMPADGFPVDRVFCLVGTNPEDYTVARGLSSKAVGARSDGLVQIDNAYVRDAHRAFVHRSHSGRYGMVNSEEGYQNLRRFLFGDLRVRADLVGLDVVGDEDDDTVWQLDAALAIRGLPVLVHEQTAAHQCPVQIERRRVDDTVDTPVPLLTTFLSSSAPRPLDPQTGRELPRLRHALTLRLISLRQHDGLLSFTNHLEQTEDWHDTLVVDIVAGTEGQPPRAWATWNSEILGAIRSWMPEEDAAISDTDPQPHAWRGVIALPPAARVLLGERAAISLTVTPR
jgi:hypothetical protein